MTAGAVVPVEANLPKGVIGQWQRSCFIKGHFDNIKFLAQIQKQTWVKEITLIKLSWLPIWKRW